MCPRRPNSKIFFSIFVAVIGIFCPRKLSFKPWEVQTFHFLEKNFEGPPHRRFEGYESVAKKSRVARNGRFFQKNLKKFKKTKSLKLSDFHYYSRIVTGSYPSNLENFRPSILCKKILRTLPIDILGGKLLPRKNRGCLEKLDFGTLFRKFKMFNFLHFFLHNISFFGKVVTQTPQKISWRREIIVSITQQNNLFF